MCVRTSGASELRKFWHFYILKLLFLSIFCRYNRYFLSTNGMLVGLYTCTDKFPNIPTNTNIEQMYVYMRASELRKCRHFYILKLLFLSIFCRYSRYFVGTNDMLVGLHVPTNFLIYRQTVTLSKCMCMRASGASELRKFWHFYILNLLFLSIFCRYIRYFVGTNDMLVGSHVPTNFQMYRQKSEKALLGPAPPPPPPSGYANARTICIRFVVNIRYKVQHKNYLWFISSRSSWIRFHMSLNLIFLLMHNRYSRQSFMFSLRSSSPHNATISNWQKRKE